VYIPGELVAGIIGIVQKLVVDQGQTSLKLIYIKRIPVINTGRYSDCEQNILREAYPAIAGI
jgi:hypothetical protein